MSVRVYIPTPFRKITGNRTFVDADGVDVNGVLRDLEQRFPGFGEMVFDGEQEVLEHVNVYLNSHEIRSLQGANTAVADGDEVAVIPAIAGGEAMTAEMVERYSRHLIMDQVGPLGQRKLIDGKVLAVGAGGLGSPVLVYLAAAGIGTIGIVDFDVVDRSNLQRQIIHGTSDIGRLKVESARARIADLNPNVVVQTHTQPLTSENAMEIIPQYDVIINGADNFATRYLVNDAAFLSEKILVDGSIFLFEGQVTTFFPRRGLLPLPLPQPAAARHGALLRRGRRARRVARHDRRDSGDRGDQKSCSIRANRSRTACCSTTRWRWTSAPSRFAATPPARSAATRRRSRN